MKIRFFDFEVFPNWWCCVFGDLPEDWKENRVTETIKDTFRVVSSDSPTARDDLMKELLEKDVVKSGYNIKQYDLIIANAIRQGLTPQEVKIVNDLIISPNIAYESKEHYMLRSYIYKRISSIDYVDLMDDCIGSLKEKEATLGLNVLESNIPFDKEDLSEADKHDVIYYCKQDVYAAAQFYMQIVEPYVNTKLAVGNHYNIPYTTCIKSTNARIVGMALGAVKRQWPDADKITIELPDRIKDYCYENLPSKILERICNNTEGFTTELFGNTVSFGNGGIHSVFKENLYVEENYDYCLLNVDAESYYPSMLIQFKTLSRNVSSPDALKYVFEERMRIKHKVNKTPEDDNIQKADKLILNTTFGASGNKWLDLYDPHMCTKTCRVGQIFLASLACKINKTIPSATIIQTNTDGILVYLLRKDLDKLKELEHEWTRVSGINMEEDYVSKIWQRDVNNYLLVMTDGKVKRKGGWLNDTVYRPGYVTLASLQAFVCTKAAQKFLLYGESVFKNIVSCTNLTDFAMVCTKGPTYRGVIQMMGNGMERELFKANRVVATTDENYGLIYKYKIYKGERRLAKMPNIPEHCLPVNKDLSSYDFRKDIQPKLDYSYYIMRTEDLLDIPWQQLVGKQVFDNHNFDFRLE